MMHGQQNAKFWKFFVAATHDYICEQKLNSIDLNKHPKRRGSLHSERHDVVEEHCRVFCIFRLYLCHMLVVSLLLYVSTPEEE